MTSTPLVATPRFRLLDGLRLLAALSVLAYHYFAYKGAPWPEPPKDTFAFVSRFAAYGALGVQMFFIISGFVILMSARGRSLGSFVSSRVARLYPAYWASVIACAVLFLVIAPGRFKTPSIHEILANLTMMQTAVDVPHLDGVYWTLWVELLFYLLVGALIARLDRESVVLGFAFVWPFLAIIGDHAHVGLLMSLAQPRYASLFAAGMVLYLIHAHGHSLLRWLLFGLNALIATYQTTHHEVLGSMAKNTSQSLSPVVSVGLMALIFGLVAVVTVTPLAHRGPRWLSYAGALTYPLYLFHEVWGWWLIGLLSPPMNKWLVVAAAAAFAVLLAALVERFIERPLRDVLRRGLNKSFAQITSNVRSAVTPPAASQQEAADDRRPAPRSRRRTVASE
ncbi:acyltransferase family protein [Microbacterium sp.]|uniref:acyltransferase family protein n=1 Tax=Microbacterium sp. TaxID=51671 RepID=UPI003A9049E2